eukprot:m.230063 g.230063  ORF g.230063 m.230063 type:complete len:96 (+) comp40052_c1_seq2:1503-1790(+)
MSVLVGASFLTVCSLLTAWMLTFAFLLSSIFTDSIEFDLTANIKAVHPLSFCTSTVYGLLHSNTATHCTKTNSTNGIVFCQIPTSGEQQGREQAE